MNNTNLNVGNQKSAKEEENGGHFWLNERREAVAVFSSSPFCSLSAFPTAWTDWELVNCTSPPYVSVTRLGGKYQLFIIFYR